ncbi:MAG: acyl-CoA dehydrogenase, partial [Burkholderiales bacterium]|nr:acyl-CoA dehydrogenase [Burkholderiales bacterium]
MSTNESQAASQALPSDEERRLLRDSVRGFLEQHWPAANAVERAAQPAALREIWRQLAGQGLTSICTDPSQGGLREALIVAQELGRAACPVPLADAAIANLALAGRRTANAELAALLDALHAGEAFACVSFGDLDPDSGTGSISRAGTRVSGHINFVDGGQAATHYLVFINGGTELAIVAASAPGVTASPTKAMGIEGLSRIEFANAPASFISIEAQAARDLLSVSRLGYAARAWGAADRAFELVVQYVKDRKQFGQPVGRFQAIQHKLTNNLIALTGIQRGIDNAAEHFDRGIEHWRTFASALWAFANASLRQVSLETHHAFGAIGYAEEHEAPRHFRRVHLDIARFGGGRAAREELAERYLGEAPNEFPEYDLGEAGNAFRREVRAWLAQHWPEERRRAYQESDTTHRDYDPDFSRELGETGWLGLTWPEKFGGMNRSPYELLAFMEEMDRAEAPRAGAPIQAAAWMTYGTPEQQQRYLPPLLRGEAKYGMWYSEPDSGSDLASLRTKAVRDGDHWVINGQKIWTTTYWAEYMWLAARTDPDAKPQHAGISMFVVHRDTPGITRTPMRTMYGGEFCNTFLDNVRVPADALVGEVNKGWQVLTGSLGTERAYVGSGILMKVARQFEALCSYIRTVQIDGKPLRLDPMVRDTIGSFAAQIEIGRQLALNSIEIYARGEEPTWEAAMAKVFAGELMERFNEAALDMLGMRATLSEGNADA